MKPMYRYFLAHRSCPNDFLPGLIYLKRPRTTPPPSPETLILVRVVRSLNATNDYDDDNVIAASVIPVARIRFPLEFKFPLRNKKKKDLNDPYRTTDLYVEAQICSADGVDRIEKTCRDTTPILQGNGIAKVLSLPSGDEDDTTTVPIRTGVAVALE